MIDFFVCLFVLCFLWEMTHALDWPKRTLWLKPCRFDFGMNHRLWRQHIIHSWHLWVTWKHNVLGWRVFHFTFSLQWKYRDGGWASASRPFGFPPNYISSWGDPDYLVCTYPNSKTDKTQSTGLFNLFQKKQVQLLAFEFLAAPH